MKKRLLSLLLALVMLVGMIPATSLTAFAVKDKYATSVTGVDLTGGEYFYYNTGSKGYTIPVENVMAVSGSSKVDVDGFTKNGHLYSNEACTYRLKEEPVLDETYYFVLYFDLGDSTNNITDSNSTVTVDGFYNGKVVSATSTAEGEYTVICSVKYGELTGGVKAVASGVEYDSAEGGYAPTFTTLKAVSTEGKELEHTVVDGTSYYVAKSGCLYKTNSGTSFSNKLTTEPQDGETYYSYFLLDSIDGNLNIEEELVDIQIPGYEVEYLASYERDMGFTSLVVYSVTKSGVPLRDKITQMMMVDFRYWDENLEDSVSRTGFTVMNDQVRKIIEDNNFGAVNLFSNNIQNTEQTFNLIKGFQEAATKNGGTPLMIAADQEGGSVYRLGTGTALPGNMALGATYATHGTKYAKEAGKIIGSELSALGINTNFAPVLDVNNNANNQVIGLRSYSDHAVMVGELAAAEIEGMAQYNIIGCAKHFPGHGDTATDSHYGLPLVNKALSVLEQNELKPYEVAIEKGVDMIMTAHILYPQLESDKILSSKTGKAESLPATMSDDILTDLLKENMGFEGIIVTDAMNMAGITAIWDTLQSCVIAINAGVDMLCMPVSLYDMEDYAELVTIIDGIEAAVKKGDILMSRINDAYNRIMKVKENRGILNYNANEYTLEKANAVIGCEANREMEREISAAAVTVVKNENNVLPLKLTENSKVLMLVPYSNERAQMIMAWNRAKQEGLIPDGAEVDYFRFNSTTISADLKAKLDWADIYIINSEISSTSRMEGKHWLSAAPYAFCDYAEENGKIAIISSVDKPYDVQSYPKADAIVAAYGCKGSSVDPTEALEDGITGSEATYGPNIIAAVEVILGTYGAQGKLPLDIPVYDEESNRYLNKISYDRGYGLTYVAKKERKIYVGGVEMAYGTYLANGATKTQTTKPSGGYAYYKDGVLTLNNYSYEGYGCDEGSSRAIIYALNDIQIELVGNNNLTHKSNWNTACITGKATVSLTGEGTLNLQNATWGIESGYNISIESGSLNIDNCDLGIYSLGRKVIINGGNFEVNAIDCAVNGSKGIEINGGSGLFRNTQEDVYSVLHSLNGTVTINPSLIVMASTTADGELGEYVAANHASYEKIVIKPAASTVLKGDVNGDGQINLDDVVALLRHVSKAAIITDSNLLAAGEVVGDGILNLDDVVKLLRYVSKAIPDLN